MEKYKNSKPLFHKRTALKPHIYKGFLLIAVLTIFFGENLKAKIGQASKSNDGNQGVAGISSLMDAVNNGDVEGVKFFINAGDGVINQKNIGGATALHIAARNGSAEIVNILINNGADVNAIDNEGWTALMRAASFKYPEIVAILVNKNADAGKLNIFNEGALIHSASSECFECLNILIGKFNYNSIDINDLKNQINEASSVVRKKDNIAIQQLLASFLEKVNKLPSNRLTKNDDGVLEKIYNFMGKKIKTPKTPENNNSIEYNLGNKPENKSLIKEESKVAEKEEASQSLISTKDLDKKKTIYLFLGNKFSKYYKAPQTIDPSLQIKKENSELNPNPKINKFNLEKFKKEPLEKESIIPSDSISLDNKKPAENEISYSLGDDKDEIRDKSIQSELPDNKSEDDKAVSLNERKFNFLGKKHIAYKIKPLIKTKKKETSPITINQDNSTNNINPVITPPASDKIMPSPNAPVRDEAKQPDPNSVQPMNNNSKTESSSDKNVAPAINASAKSAVVPPPPAKKPISPAASKNTAPPTASAVNQNETTKNSNNSDKYAIPPLPDVDKLNDTAPVKK